MIKFFHVYRKSLVTILVAAAACLVMTSFGVNFFEEARNEYAIKVDETEISHSDFYEQRRAIQENYRRMLGDMYPQFEGTLGARLNEELSERMIADTLLHKFALSMNLFVGANEVQSYLVNEVFRGDFDMARYSQLLSDMNTSATEFEGKIAQDALRSQLSSLMSDALRASAKEASTLFEMEETSYDVEYIEIAPEDILKTISEPEESALQTLYEERSAEFEEPARVSFEYATIAADAFSGTVEIAPEDIELYYAENEAKFMTPEEISVRHIQLSYPADAKEDRIKEVRSRADKLLEQIKNGESFEKAATENSEDAKTALRGGSLGFIRRGVMPREFDAAAFKLEPGEVSNVVVAGNSFHIIRVDEKKAAAPRKLEEVKGQIEEEIRKREGPAYTAAKAQELLDSWVKNNQPLEELAAQNKLTYKTTVALLSKGQDPSPELKGITARILESPEEKKQLVESGDNYALVNITEYREAEVPPFSEVKSKVLDAYRKTEAKRLAAQKAQEAVQGFQDNRFSSLKDAAAAFKFPLKEMKSVKRKGRLSGPLASEEAGSLVFSTYSAGEKPARSFETGGKFYVLQVTAITKPAMQDFDTRRENLQERASDLLAQTGMSSLVNMLKSKAQIDVDQSIMSID